MNRKEKIKMKQEKMFCLWDYIIMGIAGIIIVAGFTQMYHDHKYNCNNAWDEEKREHYSSGCREECGCITIATYELIIPLNETGTVINEIIKNITENEYE